MTNDEMRTTSDFVLLRELRGDNFKHRSAVAAGYGGQVTLIKRINTDSFDYFNPAQYDGERKMNIESATRGQV